MTLLEISYQIIKNPGSSQDFFLKYLPVLSPIIVIATFIFNNRYDRKNKRRDANRSWYFKAYFEPNIKKIEDFFKEADNKLIEGKDLFNKNFKSNKKTKNNQVIATTLSELSKLKRKFSFEVLEIIRPAYPSEYQRMNELLMDFEDAGSDVFSDTQKEISDQIYFTYVSQISIIKANLIQVLSGPALV
ncbi:hypothetical protein ACFE6N_22815 [Pedobacter sp. BG31]|uniref:hypothetical protein n=1 Tax=Pedobacter sp. BG31 TaxID=3349697 RepID=UPI0035F23261